MTREEAIAHGKEQLEVFGGEHREFIEMAIKALEQEPRKDEIILTKEEYRELVSSEFDNGYAKGYREALEQEPILDKIIAEIETEYGDYDICEWYEDYDYEENDISEYQRVGSVSDILEIIDKYKAESEE